MQLPQGSVDLGCISSCREIRRVGGDGEFGGGNPLIRGYREPTGLRGRVYDRKVVVLIRSKTEHPGTACDRSGRSGGCAQPDNGWLDGLLTEGANGQN